MTRERQSERQRNARSRLRLWLATAALLILLPGLGLGVGVARDAGLLVRWQRLGPLPARGVEIVTGTTDTVYVRTDSGSIYACSPKSCWVEVKEPLETSSDHPCSQLLYQGEVKPPAGMVVDTLETSTCYAEVASEARYALMQDGSVLKWRYDQGLGSEAVLVLGPIAGLILSLVGIAVLWVRKGVLARRAHAKRKKG